MSATLTAEALASVTGLWPRQPPGLQELLAAEEIGRAHV